MATRGSSRFRRRRLARATVIAVLVALASLIVTIAVVLSMQLG